MKFNSRRRLIAFFEGRLTLGALLMALVLAGPAVEPAAFADNVGPVVSSTGHATLKERPEILRLKLMMKADGKDAREAIATLVENRDGVKQQLLSVGATGTSFDPGELIIGTGELTPQQRQIEIMMRAAQPHAPATTQPQSVTVSCTLTAEFPLTAAPADAVAAAEELKEKIKSVLPKGLSKKPMTPEEQEIAEEMSAANNSDSPGPKPDEPTFIFVHKLTDEERAKVFADAFADATAEARRLAVAAGKTLGPIRQISLAGGAASDAENPFSAYVQAFTDPSTASAADSSEATGPQAGSVAYTVHLNTGFDLK